ncbi:hypothetical protein ACFQX6_24870 [Streptosporangium lutulentum]
MSAVGPSAAGTPAGSTRIGSTTGGAGSGLCTGRGSSLEKGSFAKMSAIFDGIHDLPSPGPPSNVSLR